MLVRIHMEGGIHILMYISSRQYIVRFIVVLGLVRFHDLLQLVFNVFRYRNMCRFNSGVSLLIECVCIQQLTLMIFLLQFFYKHPLLAPYKYYWRVESVKYILLSASFDTNYGSESSGPKLNTFVILTTTRFSCLRRQEKSMVYRYKLPTGSIARFINPLLFRVHNVAT